MVVFESVPDANEYMGNIFALIKFAKGILLIMQIKEDVEKLFAERSQRFIDASDLKEPDYVPILSQINAYAIGYAGHTAWEAFDDYDLERECYRKANTDFYFDGMLLFGLNHPFKAYFDVGSPTYMVAENNVTIQHIESSQMNADEYDEFIEDPIKFIAEKVGGRKIAKLNADYPESYEALEKLLNKITEFKQNSVVNKKYVTEELGFPVISSRSAANPCDNFFDFIRGFKGTLTDIRRDISKVERAIGALTPYYEKNIPSSQEPKFPWLLSTAHIAPFLSRNQFERLYWPYMKRCVEAAYNCGTKYICFMEGVWKQHYDLFDELPKGAYIAALEGDDIFEFKKRFGDRMAIAGGMPQGMLKYSSAEECIDHTKKVYDACAPGGGFIFTLDKSIVDPADVNADTFRKVNEFAHEYGKY